MTLRKGDRVRWRSHGSTTTGTVQKRITDRTTAAGRDVAASKDDPQYLVKSDKSGKEAVHRPESLRKLEESSMDNIEREFDEAVNMTRKQLTSWLETEESRSVGDKDDDEESTGHASGRRIVEILGKKKSDLTDADRSHMRKVVGYVHRHLAQRPAGDVSRTDWRYSLMNWGHDPEKD